VPRTASTDDANARGRCATRCYIRRLIDRRAQARRMAAFAVSGYSITTHFANCRRWLAPAPRYTRDLRTIRFLRALSNSTMGMQLICTN